MFDNITEIYQAGATVEIVTKSDRSIRITAQRIVRGPLGDYRASYEVRDENGGLWRDRSSEFPEANGSAEEQCLRMALGFINDQERKLQENP